MFVMGIIIRTPTTLTWRLPLQTNPSRQFPRTKPEAHTGYQWSLSPSPSPSSAAAQESRSTSQRRCTRYIEFCRASSQAGSKNTTTPHAARVGRVSAVVSKCNKVSHRSNNRHRRQQKYWSFVYWDCFAYIRPCDFNLGVCCGHV